MRPLLALPAVTAAHAAPPLSPPLPLSALPGLPQRRVRRRSSRRARLSMSLSGRRRWLPPPRPPRLNWRRRRCGVWAAEGGAPGLQGRSSRDEHWLQTHDGAPSTVLVHCRRRCSQEKAVSAAVAEAVAAVKAEVEAGAAEALEAARAEARAAAAEEAAGTLLDLMYLGNVRPAWPAACLQEGPAGCGLPA